MMNDGIALASVVSTLGFPLKNPPTAVHEEDKIRAERVQVFMARYENNLDIWTGSPLSAEEITKRSEKAIGIPKLNNKMFAVYPYKHLDMWVFDDDSVGLVKEPFVGGTDLMIEKAIETFKLKNAEDGFALIFSNKKFKEFNVELIRQRESDGGNYYSWKYHNMEGWLCPALLKYFDAAPEKIYAEIKEAI